MEGQQTPAGWYKDPATGNDRYWDGQQWTEQTVQKQDGLVIAGWITAILFTPAGLVIGIIVAARGNKMGYGIIALSLAVAAIGVAVSMSMSSY
jgi:hypothetical protein